MLRWMLPETWNLTVWRICRQSQHLSPPYVPPIDKNGDLFDTVIGHIPEYQRPEWDGIAYLAFETPADLQAVFSQEQFQTKILPEDRAIFRVMAPVLATEHILLPSVTQRDPLLLVKTHLRHNGMDRPEFQKFWLHEHANLVLAQSATHRYVKRYVQLHNTGPTAAGEPFWHPAGSRVDGITIMAFASMNDVEDFLLTEDYQKIAAHEHQITDPRTSAYWTALNYNIVNRGYPEHATAR